MLTSRGVWTPDGTWLRVPYVDENRAELIFRHKMLRLLHDRGLISQQQLFAAVPECSSRTLLLSGSLTRPCPETGALAPGL